MSEGKRNLTDLESSVLISLIQTLNSNVESQKDLQRSGNATLALLVTQIIELRGEISARESETLVTRAWRTDVEIKALEAKDLEYAAELKKVHEAQAGVQTQLEVIKTGRGQTEEKIRTKVIEALAADKIDIKGIKIPSRFVPYFLIFFVVVIALLILFDPQAIAGLLSGLASLIGGSPK